MHTPSYAAKIIRMNNQVKAERRGFLLDGDMTLEGADSITSLESCSRNGASRYPLFRLVHDPSRGYAKAVRVNDASVL
mgnify:CR=1 FL=1